MGDMTDREIFIKAHKKAYPGSNPELMFHQWIKEHLSRESYDTLISAFIVAIIFHHDFAKAFWGEEPTQTGNYYTPMESYSEGELVWESEEKLSPAWGYHLQMMVLEKEPLKYLERFL